MTVHFHLQDNELVIRRASAELVWRGMPGGWPARTVIELPDEDAAIVLVQRPGRASWAISNVLKVSGTGSIVWEAEIGAFAGADTYVGIRWTDGKLTANTWTGWLAKLDPATGRILGQTFVK